MPFLKAIAGKMWAGVALLTMLTALMLSFLGLLPERRKASILNKDYF